METGVARRKSSFPDLAITELLRRLAIGHFLEGVGMIFPLKNPPGAKWIVGGVDDTIYKGKDAEINGWGKFYLPHEVKMKVIGVIDGTSCPNEQLVLMICEDGALYAYDGEELHAVASNLDQLWDEGIEYPAAKSYYKGEAFKDMTKEEWAEVRKGAVGRRLEEEHRKLVTAHKSTILAILKSTKEHKGAVSSGAGTDISKKPKSQMSQRAVSSGAGTDIRKKPESQMSQLEFQEMRTGFVFGVSGAVFHQLLDHLRELDILTNAECESVQRGPYRVDKARFLFDLVKRKGQTETMMKHLREIDPSLCKSFGLL